jgi:hypothetical protein
MAVEVAMKSWLSGGRQVINKKTWFAHLFRTQTGFGFPYRISSSDQKKAREYSNKFWKGNKWPKQTRKLEWLIDRFGPLPGWHDLDVAKRDVQKKSNVDVSVTPRKGIVYYTDNRCEERLTRVVREQIKKACPKTEIISVSQFPIDFGKNIVVPWERSVLTMFKQILIGLEESKADIVFLCEHDVIYHPSHFEFCPPKKDVYYYNENNWALDAKTGQALFYRPRQTVSGLCAYRTLLLEHYKNRIKRVEREGFTRRMGFEPGKKLPRGIDNYRKEGWLSECPNIDVKGVGNLTRGRFKLEEYRCRNRIKDTWTLADEIPFWGKTKGRFEDFIMEVSQGVHCGKN